MNLLDSLNAEKAKLEADYTSAKTALEAKIAAVQPLWQHEVEVLKGWFDSLKSHLGL